MVVLLSYSYGGLGKIRNRLRNRGYGSAIELFTFFSSILRQIGSHLPGGRLYEGEKTPSYTYGDFQTAEVVQMATNGDKMLFGPHLEGK